MRSVRVWARKVWGFKTAWIIPVVAVVLVAAACDDGSTSKAQKGESGVRASSYDQLVAAEPAHPMTNPVSRETINFWIDTWNKVGQLAFVYVRENGQTTGYYVFTGPPVSYCTALTPTYEFVDAPGDQSDAKFSEPVPGVDGVWYSGGDCNVRYGRDAATGRYIEFSYGNGLNYILSTTPLPQFANAPKLGDADVSKATVDPATGVAKVGS